MKRFIQLLLVALVSWTSSAAISTSTWVKKFGGTGADTGSAVAVDPSGNIYTAGTFTGTATFGTNTFTSAGAGDIFLMKTSSDGTFQWAHGYGSTGDEWVQKILLDASGNIYLCGGFNGSGNFGGTNTVSAGDVDGWIAKYSSSGTFVWSRTLGGTGTDQFNGIALDSAQQNLIAIGFFQGTVVFTPTTTFVSKFGGVDSFLSKYSVVDGSPLWAKTWGGIDYDSGIGVYTDAIDNIIVMGWFAFQINLGSGVISAVTGQRDPYIGKFAPTSGTNVPGASLWAFRYGSLNTTTPFCSGLDANGDLTVGGTFQNQSDLGTGVLTGGGLSSAFLAKYSGATGAAIWSRSLVSNGSVTPYGVSFDTSNNPIFCGSYDTFCNFGNRTFTSAGALDIFVAKYTAAVGSPVWAQSYGGPSGDGGTAVAVDSANYATVTGYFTGTANFAGTSLTATGSNDAFLIRTAPNLHYVDNSLSTGANDGTSWANAWRHLNSINFASIAAGDTIYISGGSTVSTQTYGGFFNDSGAAPNGTSGNPITITMGADSAHNGTAIFDGAENGDTFSYINLINKQYWVIDGQSAGDGQRHMWFNNLFNANANQRTMANKIYADGSVGMVFKYLNGTNDNQFISVVNAQSFYVGNCYARWIRGDAAIRAPGCGPSAFDSNIIEHNQFFLAYCTNHALCDSVGTNFLGPDGIQGSHGLTIRYNYTEVEPVSFCTSTQHPDDTQLTGNFNKMYGNEYVNVGDSIHDFDWVFNPTPHDIRIYNEVYRITKALDPFPEYIRWYSSAGTSFSSMNNILIANNTFADNTTWSDLLCNWGASGTASLSGWVIANNIHVNGAAYSIPNNPQIIGNSLGFGTNVYAPAFQFTYRGTTYNSTTWPSAGVEPSASFATPIFVSYAPNAVNNDFHLATNDLVANGKGVDLSAYFTTDKDGTVRTPPWSIGAYQASSAPPPDIPSTPSNVTPSNLATSVSLSPTLTGSAYSDPGASQQAHAQFIVYASDHVTVVWDSGTLGAVNSVIVGATLANSTVYFWTVRYQNTAANWSSYSPQTQFTTVPVTPPPDIPNTPTNLTPANLATAVSLTPTLTASAYSDPGASPQTHAQFIVYASDHTTVVWDSGTLGAVTSATVSTPLANSTVYFWTARYQNSVPTWSAFSTQTQFTTVPVTPPPDIPNTPSNITPANLAVSVSITPSLTASAYSDPGSSPQAAAQFIVYASDHTTIVWDSGTLGAVNSTVVGTTLANGTIYFWSARYENSVTNWSSFSTQTQFTTVPVAPPDIPNTPSNVTPANLALAVSLSPTLTASAYSDPGSSPQAHAQFIVYGSDHTTVAWDSGTLGAVNSVVVGTTLSNGTVYFWTTRYQNSVTNWSAFSPQTQFTTVPVTPLPPVTPSNSTPANGATGIVSTPTLTGSVYSDPNSPVSPKTHAEFFVYAANQTDVVWDSGVLGAVTSTTVPVGTLANGTLYWWSVRYQNTVPLWSAQSAKTSFTTSSPQPPVGPTRMQAVIGKIGKIVFP